MSKFLVSEFQHPVVHSALVTFQSIQEVSREVIPSAIGSAILRKRPGV